MKILKKLLFVPLIILIIFQTGCMKTAVNNSTNTQKQEIVQNNLDIMVTNKDLYYMVNEIAGENNSIEYMFSDEDKLQKFTPSSDSETNVAKYDLFFYSGASFEPWVDNFLNYIDKGKIGIINVSRGVSLNSFGNKLDSNYGLKNPYYWLDYNNYKAMLLNIRNAVEEKDPQNRDIYETNFENAIKTIDEYKKQKDKLDASLKNCTFVTDKDDFDYYINETGAQSIKFYRDAAGNIGSSDETQIANQKSKGNALFFIYKDDGDLNANQALIEKYNMIPIKFVCYDGNMTYLKILETNDANVSKALATIKK